MAAGVQELEGTTVGDELRSLRKHTLVYGIGVVLSKLASFIMLPVYTHYLSPADYGVLELLSMTIEIIGTMAGAGLLAGVYKLHADADSPEEKRRILSTALVASTAIALATTVLGVLFSPVLTGVILGADGRPEYFRLFFLIYLFQTMGVMPGLVLRMLQRSTLWVTTSVIRLVAQLSLNICFVVWFGMGITGVLLGNLLATALVSLVLMGWLVRHTGIAFSRDALRALSAFGNPMVIWSLANFVLVFADRFFLKHYVDASAVGIYSLAYKFAFMLSAFAFAPFKSVWEPQRFAIAKRPDAGRVFSRVFVYVNFVLGSMALVIALFIKDIIRVMAAPEFLQAYKFVPVLLAAQVVFHWVTFCNVGILAKGRTRRMAEAAVVGVVVTIVLNFLLVPRYGIYGATAATFVAYGARFLNIYWYAQREFPIPYEWSAILKLLGLFGTVTVLRYMIETPAVAVSLGTSSLFAIAALGLAYRYVLSAEERAYAQRAVRSTVRRSRAALALGRS